MTRVGASSVSVMENFERKAAISLFSSYASQLATTVANVATKLILARLIAPNDLGVYALALLIMLAGDMLMDMGVSQHIVREKDRPYGNFLLLRMVIATVLFAAIQVGAPVFRFWGAEFPHVIRGMSIILVIKAASGVPNVFLDRELLIHRSVMPQLARITAMGLVSIGLAHFGHGVWALVWGTVVAEALFAVLIWRAARSGMRLRFTWAQTISLIRGSRFLFLIGLMGFALQQGDVAIIGTLLTPREVGYYTMAFTLIVLVSKVVENAVFRVIYPVFCEKSGDIRELGKTYRLATLAITAVEAPIYFFLLFNAPVLVPLMLGGKWLPAVALVQALSIFGIINPFSTFGNEVLRARKRDAVLTLSTVIGAITLMTSGCILASRYGTMGVVAAHYIIIGSIPTIITVYRTVKSDFLRLARQLAVVYATSFAAIALASLAPPFSPCSKALISGLLVPVCWYMYYKAFADGMGRRTIGALLAMRSVGSAELSPGTGGSG